MRTARSRPRSPRHAPEATGLLPFSDLATTATITTAVSRAVPADITGCAFHPAGIHPDLVAAFRQPAFRQTAFRQTAFRQTLAEARALVRGRRFGFYMDVLGATFFMALFVAAAILV